MNEESPEFDVITDHAEAVGLLCIYMASLDNAITVLMERLLETDEATAACIATTARDMAQRCEIVSRLAHLKAPNDVWRECTIGLLNLVQNELAPRRNRFVHDDWQVRENEMVRYDRRVRIRRPQSHQPPDFIHVTESVATVAEIRVVITIAVDAMVHLTFLGSGYVRWRRGGPQPTPPQQAIDLSNYRFP